MTSIHSLPNFNSIQSTIRQKDQEEAEKLNGKAQGPAPNPKDLNKAGDTVRTAPKAQEPNSKENPRNFEDKIKELFSNRIPGSNTEQNEPEINDNNKEAIKDKN